MTPEELGPYVDAGHKPHPALTPLGFQLVAGITEAELESEAWRQRAASEFDWEKVPRAWKQRAYQRVSECAAATGSDDAITVVEYWAAREKGSK